MLYIQYDVNHRIPNLSKISFLGLHMMIGGDLQLPKPIIQHVQYFLDGKDAARTTVLSKSWHSAWLTRPNLEFNEWDFERYSNREDGLRFYEFAKKIIQRYEESNLRIDRLVIHMKTGGPLLKDLTSELIVKALKLGASHIYCECGSLVLPREVFEAENLVELSLVRCHICRHQDTNNNILRRRSKKI
ncbi:hypothetical protein CASFOL_015818 [Castilleja foliolosa]|uniref:Uncharacterized protein n=1 Tax=Castilleja foliolosa TaxID=1961234 RepID=A0ABD3DEU1_9LAMI